MMMKTPCGAGRRLHSLARGSSHHIPIATAPPNGTDRTELTDTARLAICAHAVWAGRQNPRAVQDRHLLVPPEPMQLAVGRRQLAAGRNRPRPQGHGSGHRERAAQVVKEGDLRIHPQVAGLVDAEMRGKMMGGAA
jgi:hypothetical protein